MTPKRTYPKRKTGPMLVGLVCLSLLMAACRPGTCYHDSKVFDHQRWDMNDTVYFTDTLGALAEQPLRAELTLRHTNLYPYQNLWLYVTLSTSHNRVVSDSINWTLAKPDGTWLGSGWGSLYTITYDLPELTFAPDDSIRWFRVELVHGLRDSLLTGLSDLVLRLWKE